jgi:predicted HAD superfamily Cof-like phosphohydrolase
MDDKDLFGMVAEFHKKFELEPTSVPSFPIEQIWKLKNLHLQEELNEIRSAAINDDLEEYFDGLIDLVYVALGAAYLAGLPFDEGFRRVHAANMKKVRATHASESKRGSVYDIFKPVGWEPPVLEDLIRKEKE